LHPIVSTIATSNIAVMPYAVRFMVTSLMLRIRMNRKIHLSQSSPKTESSVHSQCFEKLQRTALSRKAAKHAKEDNDRGTRKPQSLDAKIQKQVLVFHSVITANRFYEAYPFFAPLRLA
jgi:hypothetical protein